MKRYVLCRMFAGSEEYLAVQPGVGWNWRCDISGDCIWHANPGAEWSYGLLIAKDCLVYVRELTITLGNKV